MSMMIQHGILCVTPHGGRAWWVGERQRSCTLTHMAARRHRTRAWAPTLAMRTARAVLSFRVPLPGSHEIARWHERPPRSRRGGHAGARSRRCHDAHHPNTGKGRKACLCNERKEGSAGTARPSCVAGTMDDAEDHGCCPRRPCAWRRAGLQVARANQARKGLARKTGRIWVRSLHAWIMSSAGYRYGAGGAVERRSSSVWRWLGQYRGRTECAPRRVSRALWHQHARA